ncbi:hypothetical protein DFH08DRAFT_946566 [Mycena albidolilacea]|uniref:Uncharacterized protein n=1 Tax=Mycena albidolilacea TaxID=1033008 RepID=A0AAD7AT90_9AGAR|nr:hypothetical protein DFH08DRAFT_946566 [Mycena albidolilacea]
MPKQVSDHRNRITVAESEVPRMMRAALCTERRAQANVWQGPWGITEPQVGGWGMGTGGWGTGTRTGTGNWGTVEPQVGGWGTGPDNWGTGTGGWGSTEPQHSGWGTPGSWDDDSAEVNSTEVNSTGL